MPTARGVRNNNPGNIDFSKSNAWQGQLPFDPTVESRFARFDTPENGIRALGKLLQNYQTRYGLKTVAAIIARWAPSTENDTAAYVQSVETNIPGLPHGAAVDLTNPLVLGAFVRAIIVHENGGNPYADSVVDEGVRRALA